jgi:hypothetical protein
VDNYPLPIDLKPGLYSSYEVQGVPTLDTQEQSRSMPRPLPVPGGGFWFSGVYLAGLPSSLSCSVRFEQIWAESRADE